MKALLAGKAPALSYKRRSILLAVVYAMRLRYTGNKYHSV